MILVGVAVLLVGFGLWLVHLGGIRRLLRRATTASGVRPSPAGDVLDRQLVSVELAKQLVLGLAPQPSQRSTSLGAADS
jgi:hypothetical protein